MPDDGSNQDSIADPSRITTRQEFAHELTLLRAQAGLSVRDVARAMGVPSGTVGDYFAARHLPPAPHFKKLLFICGVEDAAAMKGWLEAWSVLRVPPGRRRADAPVPYRGLESFQTEDAEWFKGREELTGILLSHLRMQYDQGGLLVLVGPSGSGKSSLLRAGLVPALHSGELSIPGSYIWPLALFTPGARPVHELAIQLALLTDSSPDDVTASLLSRPACCRDLARQAANPEGNGGSAQGGDGDRVHARLVIVVDQFEEIFTACQDEAERRAFIAALCAAGGQDSPGMNDDEGKAEPAALVVLGLRADFYPHALRYPAFAPALQDHQVLVPPMTEAELRRVIVEPARKAGLEIEDGLVELLLSDLSPTSAYGGLATAHDAGALPLLSYALRTTWERSHGRKLLVADYREVGGIRGSIAAAAEQVYSELSPDQQDLARQIFIRLVHVADDTADTRRRVPRSELLLGHGAAQPVLDVFIEKRLITSETDDVEIAHDALLLAWPRLREWIDNDRTGVVVHRQLTTAAKTWQDGGKDPELLYSGGRLTTASDWANEPAHAGDLNIPERDFLDASVKHRLAEERSARLRAHRLQRLAAVLTALFLVAGFLAVFAFQQKSAATYQRDVAISRQVATDADQLRSTDIALAMQLALAAYRISPTTEAQSSLLDLTAGLAATRMIGPVGTEMHAVALNPGKTVLAAGSADGSVRLWDVARQGHPVSLGRPLTVRSGAVTSVALSPDGRMLAAGSAGSTVWVWDVGDPRRPVLLGPVPLEPAGVVNSVAFSPDGRTLAAASSDGDVYLWNADNAHHISPLVRPLRASTGQVNSIVFSPNGRTLAAGDSNGYVRLWSLGQSGLPLPSPIILTGPANGVNSVAFSPDSRTLAAGGNDDKVWLWDMDGDRRPLSAHSPLTGPTSWIYSIAFSPDGNSIAAGSADNNAYVWNLATGSLVATLAHPAPVLSVTYGRGSDTLATGDADGIARMWILPGPILTGSEGSVFAVAFNTNGHTLAVASGDGTVRLWDVADPAHPVPVGVPLTASDVLDGTVAYGPGGRLAAGTGNGSIELWNVRNPGHPVRLPSPPTALNSAIQYVAFDHTGRLMAAGSTNGSVELWDAADVARTKPLAVLPADGVGPGHDVFAVVFSPDDRLLASANDDGTVRLWDISRPAHPTELGPPLVRLTSAIYQVAFSPDGRILAASGEDGKVRLWDVTDPVHPHLLSILSGPVGIVYDVSFSPDGRSLATANGDKTVSLWDIANPAEPTSLGSLTGPSGTVFSVAYSPTGNAIAAGSQDNTTRLWLTTPASAAAYICSVTGDPITRTEWTQYVSGLPYNPPCAARD